MVRAVCQAAEQFCRPARPKDDITVAVVNIV
jgi:hypothetical protein